MLGWSISPVKRYHNKESLQTLPCTPGRRVAELLRLSQFRMFFYDQGHPDKRTNMRPTNVATITMGLALSLVGVELPAQEPADERTAGASEDTPSLAEYFSWINNTNEGATEAQTLVNLAFFEWLRDEYGMQLDIYAFDAGAIDGPRYYGSMRTEKFRTQFPNGFDPMYEKARSLGIRLGLWAGPDGFGDTPAEERARIEMMVSLCRDYDFQLFKFDAVATQLRPEKRDAFIELMRECRRYAPDLIALNHRLDLGHAAPYVTTFLWEGAETYIDVWMNNTTTATHNRAGALARGLPPDLKRLTEDHGVCLSSSLDYWEDDLVLQAFNRSLILAPQLYGSPWFLRDDEFPKLARLFNLHRKYRDILVSGVVLPEDEYGPHAVSRGDDSTRLITLRNLAWRPVTYTVALDESIGLTADGPIQVRSLHPTERVLGRFENGDRVEVEVLPFRSYLLLATAAPIVGVGIRGADFQVVRDVPGEPVVMQVMGMPGDTLAIQLDAGGRRFQRATLDGERFDDLAFGDTVDVAFGGRPLSQPWHRRLGEPGRVQVPADAEALYEATIFVADNNALEIRSLQRSGPTSIPQVRAARDAFIDQAVLVERGVWDDFVWSFNRDLRIEGGALRVDFGSETFIDRVTVRTLDDTSFAGRVSEGSVQVDASVDLREWFPAQIHQLPGARIVGDSVSAKTFVIDIPAERAYRYLLVDGGPDRVTEIEGYHQGRRLDNSDWRASNLFAGYARAPAIAAWSSRFVLGEAAIGSYLAIAIDGAHGVEKAYAALRVDGRLVGAPERAVAFPSNTWEYPVHAADSNYTYFVPLTPDMIGAEIEAVVLVLEGGSIEIEPAVWITAYPIPFAQRELVLYP